MKSEFLDSLCLKHAYIVFGEVSRIFGYPHKWDLINEMENYAYSVVRARYNEKEQDLIIEHLKKMFQEYKAECEYHDLTYR